MENIKYDIPIQNERLDCDRLNELMGRVVDNVCYRREILYIARDDYPAGVVESRFLKLNNSHIEYVLDRMRENSTYVCNIKNICWLPHITPRLRLTAERDRWLHSEVKVVWEKAQASNPGENLVAARPAQYHPGHLQPCL